MEKINEAWKNASEEMYKAQEGAAGAEGAADAAHEGDQGGADDVTDVEYEEVK
jgi:molecular chaperone DnaK